MLACISLFQALGRWGQGKRESERKNEKNEGGLVLVLVLPRFFLFRFRSSPTTESLEQAKPVYAIDSHLLFLMVSSKLKTGRDASINELNELLGIATTSNPALLSDIH